MYFIEDQSDLDALKKSPVPVVIDFYATWCGPCKILGKVMDELEVEYKGFARFVKCNVEAQEKIAESFGIRNVPTIVFLKDGEQVNKMSGALPKVKLKAEIDALMNG